jgi:hypothetical protein
MTASPRRLASSCDECRVREYPFPMSYGRMASRVALSVAQWFGNVAHEFGRRRLTASNATPSDSPSRDRFRRKTAFYLCGELRNDVLFEGDRERIRAGRRQCQEGGMSA